MRNGDGMRKKKEEGQKTFVTKLCCFQEHQKERERETHTLTRKKGKRKPEEKENQPRISTATCVETKPKNQGLNPPTPLRTPLRTPFTS